MLFEHFILHSRNLVRSPNSLTPVLLLPIIPIRLGPHFLQWKTVVFLNRLQLRGRPLLLLATWSILLFGLSAILVFGVCLLSFKGAVVLARVHLSLSRYVHNVETALKVGLRWRNCTCCVSFLPWILHASTLLVECAVFEYVLIEYVSISSRSVVY